MDNVSLPKFHPRRIRWLAWVSLSFLLDQWYSAAPSLILYSDENRRSIVCYEHVFFVVYRVTVLGEDRDVSIDVGLTTLIKDVESLSKELALAVSLDSNDSGSLVSHLS